MKKQISRKRTGKISPRTINKNQKLPFIDGACYCPEDVDREILYTVQGKDNKARCIRCGGFAVE